MKAAVSSDTTNFTRKIYVLDAPLEDAGYPRGQYKIRPEMVEYSWTNERGPTMIHVSGPRLLKSGEFGHHQRVSFALGETSPNAIWPAPPAWILEVLA